MGESIQSSDLFTGEVREKSIKIVGSPIAPSSATFQVFSINGKAQGVPQAATVSGDTISGTVSAGTSVGKFYVEFTYILGGFTCKTRLHYDVK